MTFKDRLRDEIEYQGKLVKEISAEIGISNSTFLSYIDARGSLPNVETAVKIARALNTSVEYLVTGEPPNVAAADKIAKPSFERNAKRGALNTEIDELVCDLNKINKAELKAVKTIVHALADGHKA